MYKTLLAAGTALGITALANPANAISVDLDLGEPDSRDGALVEVVTRTTCSGYWIWRTCTTRETSTESNIYATDYTYNIGGDTPLNMTATGWSYDSNSEIVNDYIGNWSELGPDYGLGVEVADSPDHAIDNRNGDYDMILLSFDQAVSLESISSGWRGNGNWLNPGTATNSEASLMAFTGDLSDLSSFEGKQWQDLLSEGWESAGNTRIDNLNQDTSANSGGLTSRYWLIGAYNANISSTSGFTDGNDFFKLNGVSVNVNPVPLPGSLLLFGTGLLAFGSLRKRRKTA
ncbi:exosortase-dependent surface protein XDP1 [Teredinibacter waterburyi]|jgi:PEP-CTERM putative exosortase interaction domain|uniref:exosortase-dependent surface protein XDP1 n=1 Tax=Teredinibacter waterburyi TaxID=1500538 RepID=UPI00165FABDD|nr:exosortase-dependent surface protein XDP1 [Teredinibacter waterburyi]